nr:3-deoxy-manno-octulosonate cytidylyltransferase [uncultured Desulfobacter sp.]
MKVVAIVPARMGSSRFPGKPLADILGLPMIEHVRRRVLLSSAVQEVIVATCDSEIMDAVNNNGGKAVMTADSHERCTDRVAEAALQLDADIVINVQGDEPLVRPEIFSPLVAPLIEQKSLACTNMMAEISAERDFLSPDVVKTVVDINDQAVYFSREPIPSLKKAPSKTYKKYRQLGIIAFKSDFLQKFTMLPETPLESIESVDMLRAVEHGFPVQMVLTEYPSIGVDTPEDLRRAIEMMRHDDLFGTY